MTDLITEIPSEEEKVTRLASDEEEDQIVEGFELDQEEDLETPEFNTGPPSLDDIIFSAQKESGVISKDAPSTRSFTPGYPEDQPGPLQKGIIETSEGARAAAIQVTMGAKVADLMINYTPEQIEQNPKLLEDIIALEKDIPNTLQGKTGLSRFPYLAGSALYTSMIGLEAGVKGTALGAATSLIVKDPRVALGVRVVGTAAFAYEKWQHIMTGMALIDLYKNKEIRENVPFKDIFAAAKVNGRINAAIETVGDLFLLRTLPLGKIADVWRKPVKEAVRKSLIKTISQKAGIKQALRVLNSKIGKFATATASEVMEENLQLIADVSTENYLMNLRNELRADNVPLKDVEYIITQMKSQFADNLMSALAVSGGFSMVGATVEETVQQVNDIRQAHQAAQAKKDHNARMKKIAKEDEQRYQKIRRKDRETAPRVADDVQVINDEGVAFRQLDAHKENIEDFKRGKPAPVTDEEIDNIILSSEDSTAEGISELVGKQFSARGTEYTADFSLNLRDIVKDEEKAENIESLFESRADALGVTVEDYFKARKISLENRTKEKVDGKKAAVIFTSEGETIIQAFQGADITSMIHEVGHVFRRDLSDMELGIAEKWLGIEDGTWGIEHEERFAVGFEKYLQDGKAPTVELQTVFKKFAKWITEVWSTVRNNIVLDDNIRGVYDRLFTDTGREVPGTPSTRETLFQSDESQQTDPDKPKIPIQTAFEKKILEHVEKARVFASEGNKDGYTLEYAKIKELLSRANLNRIAVVKKQKLRQRINHKIKKFSRPKKINGKLVNKVTMPGTVAYFETLENIRGLSRDQVKQKYFEIHDEINSEFSIGEKGEVENKLLSPEDLIAYNLLKSKAFARSMSVEDLQNLHDDIQQVIDTGKSERSAQLFAEAERINNLVLQALETLKFPDGKLSDQLIARGKDPISENGFKVKAFSGFDPVSGIWINAWHDYMDSLDTVSGSPMKQGFFAKFGQTIKQENTEQESTRLAMEQVLSGLAEAYGIDKNLPLQKMLDEGDKILNRENFELVDLPAVECLIKDPDTGKYKETVLYNYFTYPEMRQRVLELMQEDKAVQRTFSETMGYRDADGKTGLASENGRILLEALRPQDKKIISFVRSFYDNSFDSLNKVYRQMTGADLTRHKNYVPNARHIQEKGLEAGKAESILFGLFDNQPAATTGRIKQRVFTTTAFKQRSDTDTLMQYIVETEHYKAWAKWSRDINAVVLNPKVLKAIEHHYGKRAVSLLKDQVRLIVYGKRKSFYSQPWLDQLRINMTRATLAVRPSLTFKQLLSHPAFIAEMGVVNYFKYTGQFLKNYKQNKAELDQESSFIRNRGSHMERDVKAATTQPYTGSYSKVWGKLNLTPRQWGKLMKNIKIGDAEPIYAGVWALREFYMSPEGGGMSRSDALMQAEIIARGSQQSAAQSMMSPLQSTGTWGQLFTQYRSATILYHRRELEVIRAYIHGRWVVNGNKNSEASKRMKQKLRRQFIIYHFVLPMLYQAATDLEFDPENQIRAAVLGSFNNFVATASLLHRATNVTLGFMSEKAGLDFNFNRWYNDLNSTIPTTQPVMDILNGIEDMAKGRLTVNDFGRALQGIGVMVGRPLPFKYAVEGSKGINEAYVGLVEGDQERFMKGIFMMLGWSEKTSGLKKD
ncbi:MAG: hypothetical protein PVG39_00810 [Desulfobacteraceae bacterium]|jgi:hypothetical protein